MVTLQHLIQEYTELHKPVRDFELEGYAKELSRYGKAVYVRGLRVRDLDGRKITSVEQMKRGMKLLLDNEHQYRTRKETKIKLAQALEELRLQIYPSMTFEELYTEVGKVLGSITDLLHYDITLRIGAVNGIFPKDYVYLHAGALDGAKALKLCYPQLKVDTPRVKLSDIVDAVPELQGFTAYDVEHFLCVNHDMFTKQQNSYKLHLTSFYANT